VFPKYKIPHFLDKVVKQYENNPGPIYETQGNWKNVCEKKGKFTKSP
jgi:hypothetical protein